MARTLLTTALLGLLLLPAALRQPEGPGAQASSLQQSIDAAAPGDTITVTGGVYHERIVIDKPLTLTGIGKPVIDGDGGGDVVTITGAEVTLSGFEIRGSGRAVSQEPAAIRVENAHAPTIQRNYIRDSLYGIHMTGSHHATIAFNDIDLGSHVPQERRGHGIYLWEVNGAAIHGNHIRYVADGIHLEFSDDNGIGQNTVRDSRYALHFMYSNNNRILENRFEDNLSGAVLMFSKEILLKDNQLSSNRKGATGAGMLLKDVDNIYAEGNVVLRNKYGMTVEGTPNSASGSATFIRNTFALNDTGLGMMSNAPITFVDNAMIENTVQVKALGGDLGSHLGSEHGAAAPGAGSGSSTSGHSGHGSTPEQPTPPVGSRPDAAVWTSDGRGNYWSDYKGYDADGDGIGDAPYKPEPPFAGALEDNETLRLFQHTLAQQAIDVAADMFPVYRYSAVIEDSGPLMSPPGPALPRHQGLNQEMLIVSGLLVVLACVVLQAILDIDLAAVLRIRPRRAAGAGG